MDYARPMTARVMSARPMTARVAHRRPGRPFWQVSFWSTRRAGSFDQWCRRL